MAPTPPMHARLRTFSIIIGGDEQDLHFPPESFLCGQRNVRCFLDLRARRKQGHSIPKRPTVKLGVREFEPAGTKPFSERNYLFKPCDIALVQYNVDR